MRSGIKAFKGLLQPGKTRNPHDQESGASSVAILIAVIFLAILLFAAVNLVQFVMFNVNHFRLQDTLREPLEKEAMKVIELLYKDKTPEAESPLDQVWKYIKKNNDVALGKTDDGTTSFDDLLAPTGDNAVSPDSTAAPDSDDVQDQADDDDSTSPEATANPGDTGVPGDPNDPANTTSPVATADPDPKATKPGTYTIKLEDISSKLNLSWMDDEFIRGLISNTTLKLFKNPKGDGLNDSFPLEFNSYRDKVGLTLHPEVDYKDWVQAKAFKKGYFTAYSYFNINVTNAFVFRKIYKERIGEMGADAFERKAKELFETSIRIQPIEDGMSIQDAQGQSGFQGHKEPLKYVLGGDTDKLFPIINDLPLMNIHFMKKDFVKQLLIAYRLDAGYVDNFLNNIFYAKNKKVFAELSAKKIRERLWFDVIAPKYRSPGISQFFVFRVFDLFGAYTWFWKLTITGAAYKDELSGSTLEPKLTWIIARVPQPSTFTQDPKKLKFKILEKEFTVNRL